MPGPCRRSRRHGRNRQSRRRKPGPHSPIRSSRRASGILRLIPARFKGVRALPQAAGRARFRRKTSLTSTEWGTKDPPTHFEATHEQSRPRRDHPRPIGGIPPSRQHFGGGCRWRGGVFARRRGPACLPALGRQGASGIAADGERHRRAIRAYRRGDRARLRLPYGRAAPCGGALHARQRQGGTSCLECGTHWPSARPPARALARRRGKPTALHNNCSGKHAGFVCLACGSGEDPQVISGGPSGAAAGTRRTRRDHRSFARGRILRHRRMLDPDLRDPAARHGVRLCPIRHRDRPFHRTPRTRRGGSARRSPHIRSWSRAPIVSTRA